MLHNTRIYCSECGQDARLYKSIEEAYPGQFVTLYLSECCDVTIVDHNDKPIPQNSLAKKYVIQQSYEVLDD